MNEYEEYDESEEEEDLPTMESDDPGYIEYEIQSRVDILNDLVNN